jgi:hypothetical protein
MHTWRFKEIGLQKNRISEEMDGLRNAKERRSAERRTDR